MRSITEGINLQVHHKHYVPGKAPWEYAYSDCETLCQGCHAREHGHIRPNTGWDFIGEEDLGDILGTCELCGTSIRYVFEVHHPHWEPMSVGTICCDNLTGTQVATDIMDSRQRYESRLTRFLESPRWQKNGNILQIKQKGIIIQIVPSGAMFKIRMNKHLGRSEYHSIADAKMKAFESIENGKAEKYLESHP